MEIQIGTIPGPKGQIFFSMENYELFITSVSRQITARDKNMKEVDGKTYINIKSLNLGDKFPEIEIPAEILQAGDRARKEYELSKGSVGVIDSTHGKIYFSINAVCQLIAKLGEKAVKTNKIYDLEGRKAVFVPELSLDFAKICNMLLQ